MVLAKAKNWLIGKCNLAELRVNKLSQKAVKSELIIIAKSVNETGPYIEKLFQLNSNWFMPDWVKKKVNISTIIVRNCRKKLSQWINK